jgi:hypothetical protein
MKSKNCYSNSYSEVKDAANVLINNLGKCYNVINGGRGLAIQEQIESIIEEFRKAFYIPEFNK